MLAHDQPLRFAVGVLDLQRRHLGGDAASGLPDPQQAAVGVDALEDLLESGSIIHLLMLSRSAIIFSMKVAHQRTLEAIFSKPTPATLPWRDIEALFTALNAQVIEGRGSRVRFELNGVIATFHRPHPHKEAKPYQVRDARDFLTEAGIQP